MPWTDRLIPASFRGIEFKIDTAARAGGRRGVLHEFPKRDTPSDEDLGRRAKRWAITGYVIGLDYDRDADELEEALNRESPGMLVHPLMGDMKVRCDVYTRSENKREGGMATFDMTFIESGTPAEQLIVDATQFALRQQADATGTELGTNSNQRLQIEE